MAPESSVRQLLSASPQATEALGAALAGLARPGLVVALDGELGAGKTCFVRGFARGLGVVDAVSSPSFTLMHEYPGRLTLYHLDAWMQERGEAFLEDGGTEWLRTDGVAIVEWAERIAAWLPDERLSIRLSHVGLEVRRIEVDGGTCPVALREALAALPLPEGLTEAS